MLCQDTIRSEAWHDWAPINQAGRFDSGVRQAATKVQAETLIKMLNSSFLSCVNRSRLKLQALTQCFVKANHLIEADAKGQKKTLLVPTGLSGSSAD